MKEPCKPALICGRWDASDLLLEIRAQPRAADAGIGEVKNARLQIRLTVPPADDQANEQARKLLAKACGVGITRIQLVRGRTHRNKSFRIANPKRLPDAILGRRPDPLGRKDN